MKAYIESSTPKADKDEQATPQWVVSRLEEVLRVVFVFDVCANADNTKCGDHYWVKEDDALALCWADRLTDKDDLPVVWMNPPYSALPAWTNKAMTEARNGLIVVGCVPHMPSSVWFQKYVHNEAATVFMPDGRISFELNGKARSGNPLPTCFPVWTPWQANSSYQYFKRKP